MFEIPSPIFIPFFMQEVAVLFVTYVLIYKANQQILVINRQIQRTITGEMKHDPHERSPPTRFPSITH